MGEKKQVVYLGKEIRTKIDKAISNLASAVKVTLGPGGRNVIIRSERDYYLTKDGVSVAKSIYTYDPVEQILLDLMKDVALETNKVAGDGTTTAITIAEVIIKEGIKAINDGADPAELKAALEDGVKQIISVIERTAIPIKGLDDLIDIATVSANNNVEIGNIVANAVFSSDEDSAINIKESPISDTYVEVVNGFTFKYTGYLHNGFLNSGQKIKYNNAKLLLVDTKVTGINPFMHLLEQQKGKPVIVLARDFSDDVIRIMLTNTTNGHPMIPIKVPGIRNEKTNNLNDLAAFSEADLFSSSENFPRLGEVDSIIIDKYTTTIIKEDADTADYVKAVKEEYKDIDAVVDQDKLEQRLSNLSGKTSIIYVGGESELEVKETIDRVEDAINATKAAKAEGIIPGGGTVLFQLGLTYRDKIHPILATAIRTPLITIVENSVQDKKKANDIVETIRRSPMKYTGYDARMKAIVNMKRTKVKDPVKVTKEALKNAVAIASMLLTTEALVINEF